MSKSAFASIFILLCLPLAGLSDSSIRPTPLQQLFMLKELKPDVQRVGILLNKKSSTDALMGQINQASAATGIKVYVAYVTALNEVGPQFRSLVNNNDIAVLWILKDDQIVGNDISRSYLIKNATTQGIPILAPDKTWVNAGACLALVEGATGVKFLVNKSVAQAFSITVPDKYLEQTEFLTML